MVSTHPGVMAVTGLIGALGAADAARFARRLGVVPTPVGFTVLSTLIVTVMALSTSIIAVCLLALRSLNGAVSDVLIPHEVSKRVGRFNRATLISAASMLGGFTYGIYLMLVAGDGSTDISTYLGRFAITAWLLTAVVFMSAGLVWSRRGGALLFKDGAASDRRSCRIQVR